MIDPKGLIATSRLLLGEKNKGAPNQARLRRSVSTAYYALFHELIQVAADGFAGVKNRKQPHYEIFCRGFDHGQMKTGCKSVDTSTLGPKATKALGSSSASQEIRDVASAFVNLQERRHWADYSTQGKITRSEARDLVDLAEFAMGQLHAAQVSERKNFLAYLLLSVR